MAVRRRIGAIVPIKDHRDEGPIAGVGGRRGHSYDVNLKPTCMQTERFERELSPF